MFGNKGCESCHTTMSLIEYADELCGGKSLTLTKKDLIYA